MRDRFLCIIILLLGFTNFICNSQGTIFEQVDPINQLTEKEVEDGWVLMFDGETTTGWRNFKEDHVNEGWQVYDGNLIALGKGGDLGGDIIADKKFEDLESIFSDTILFHHQ